MKEKTTLTALVLLALVVILVNSVVKLIGPSLYIMVIVAGFSVFFFIKYQTDYEQQKEENDG